MKPATDTRQRACLVIAVATVTNRPAATVPHFIRRQVPWIRGVREWGESQGFRVEWRDLGANPGLTLEQLPGRGWRGYWVGYLSGRCKSNGRRSYHALVMRGSRIVYDNGGLDAYRPDSIRFHGGLRFER